MRNETKVGVVVGLLVVVVTSVYFYGSSREDEDVLVGLGRRGGGSNAALLDSGSNPSAALPPPAIKPASEPVRNVPPATPPLFATETPREKPKPATPATPPKPDDTLLADATRSRRSELPPLNPSPLPLRTGSSDLLDEATRRNLEPDEPASPKPTPPTMLDLSSIGDRIRLNETASANGLNPPISTAGSVQTQPPIRPSFTVDDSEPSGGVLANQPSVISAPGGLRQHRVEYGETLYGISMQYYGRSSGMNAILKANPGVKNPKTLREGQMLVIPPMDTAPAEAMAAAAPAPTPSSGRTNYVVRDGDSFYTIANRVLGDGKRWEEIYEMNKALVKNSPKRLRPGMTIVLPAAKR